MIRGIVQKVLQGVIQRFTASGRSDEVIEDREFFQHYGYTSRPKPGAELIILATGNNIISIASDDRRYRIAIEEGEVALYDDLGQKTHLTRTGIEVTSPLKITATAPEVFVVASTKITMQTPLVECTQDLKVDGNIVAVGNISDANGAKSMSGMRGTFNGHTHAEHGTGGGTTSQPSQQQ